jgi:carboxypeptidase Taq
MEKIFEFVTKKIQNMSRASAEHLLNGRKKVGRLEVARELLRSDKASGPGVQPRGDDELTQHLEKDIGQINQEIESEHQELRKVAQKAGEENIPENLSADEKENLKLILQEYGNDSEIPLQVRNVVEGSNGLRDKWGEADQVEEVEDDFAEMVEGFREYSGGDYGEVLGIWEPNVPPQKIDQIMKRVKEEAIGILEEIPSDEVQGVWERTGAEVDDSRSLEELTENPASVHEFLANYVLGGNPVRMPVRIASSGMEYGNSLMAPLQTTDQSFWAKALDTTAHEYGHTFGRENLPRDQMYLPLGEPPSEAVDEGSARFYQNHVFRSREFLGFLASESEEGIGPQDWLSAHGIPDFDPENLYGWFNAIDPNNRERISADPVTYPLHVVIRYEIEKELIESGEPAGSMVDDIHDKWQNKMQSYIGDPLRIEIEEMDESETVLQDVHWGKGKFGYFPSYTLGDVMAANWRGSMDEELEKDVGEYASNTDLDPVNDWMVENIWQHGKAVWDRSDYTKLDVEPYIDHLRDKADELYM